MSKFCGHCGAQLSEGTKFCRGCGNAVGAQSAPQPAPKQENVCPSCGYTLNPGAKFCKGCGATTGAAAAPAPAQPEPRQPQPAVQPQYQRPAQPQSAYAPPSVQQQANIPTSSCPVAQAPTSSVYRQQVQYQQPQQPVYQRQAMPPKKSGKKPLIAIVAGLAAVALIVTGIFVIPKLLGGGGDGGGDGEMARGKSVSAKDGTIELNGLTLDFGGNNVGSGTNLTVLKPTREQEPGYLLSELFEMKLDAACTSPVTVSIPFDTSLLPTGEDAEDTSVMIGLGSRFPDENGGTYTIYNYIP